MQTEASQDCFLLKIYMKMATLPLLLTDVRVKGLLPLTKPTLPAPSNYSGPVDQPQKSLGDR